ncbi:hypothetical protein ACOSQ3_006259 [Xanthoceras sorbifolium]
MNICSQMDHRGSLSSFPSQTISWRFKSCHLIFQTLQEKIVMKQDTQDSWTPEIAEDLYHLIKKAVAISQRLERNNKDKDSKFRLTPIGTGFLLHCHSTLVAEAEYIHLC